LNTRKKQLQMWTDLVLDYSRATKKFEFDLLEASKSELFYNPKINRRLPPDAIRTVFEELINQGNGEWQDKEKNRLAICWRKPEEWANLIFKWVSESGKLNTVMTLYEIQHGEDTEDQEFHGLETRNLLKYLKVLEKQGKAQIFSGNTDSNLGVKFFST